MTALDRTAPAPASASARLPCVRIGQCSWLVDLRSLLVCALLVTATGIVAVLSLGTGDYPVDPGAVVRVLLGAGEPLDEFVIETLRLPRLLTGLGVGAALGVGGAMFQSLARNPLASPDIIGFDSGAASGALVVLLVWHGSSVQTAAGAIVGGVGTALLVYLLAMKRGAADHRLILVGIGIAAMLTSLNGYLITRARLTDVHAATVWLTGSLNGRGWEHVLLTAAALVLLLPVALLLGRSLRVLELGDDAARALGIRAERVRLGSLVVGVGLAAVATAAAGPIGFIALAAPQIARRLTRATGPNIGAAACTGALLLITSDLAAQRALPDMELPVGVATALVGGAYLAWLLTSEWRRGRG